MPMKKIAGKRKPWVNPVNSGLIDFLDYYSDEKLDIATKYFVQKFEWYRDWRSPYYKKWTRQYSLYRGISDMASIKPSWQADYFWNMVFMIVNALNQRVVGSLYDMPPLMVAIPERGDLMQAARMVEMLLDTRAWQTRQFMTDYLTFKQTLMHGTGWQKIVYEIGKQYTGTRVIAKDIFDVYPDPHSFDIQESDGIFDREIMGKPYVRELARQGVFKNCDSILDTTSQTYTKFSALDRLRVVGVSDQTDPRRDKHFVEVLEFWGVWTDPDTNESFDVVVDIADRKKIVRFQENPMQIHDNEYDLFYALKPYIRFLDNPMMGEPFGIGEIEVVEQLQYMLNDQVNMKMDAMQFALSPVFQLFTGALANPKKPLVFAPGHTIEVNATAAKGDPIKPIKKDMAWTASYQEEESIKQHMRDLTGTQLAMIGREGRLRKTAAEALQLLNESGEHVRDKLRILEIDGLHERGNMIVNMERQMTDEPIYGMVMGMDKAKLYMEIMPREIDWRGALRLQAAALYGNKQIVAQSRMQFAELVSKIPGAAEQINWPEMIRRIAESLDILPENLILMPDEAGGVPAQNGIAGGPQTGGGAVVPPPAGMGGMAELPGLGAPVPVVDGGLPMSEMELAALGDAIRSQSVQRPLAMIG